MNDPVTNVLATKMEYGTDELKGMVDNHIRTLAHAEVMRALSALQYDSVFFSNLLRNHNTELRRVVLMAVKEFLDRSYNNGNLF
jgi:hypothetical protein